MNKAHTNLVSGVCYFREKKNDNISKGFVDKTINRVCHKSDEWTAFFQKQIMEGKQI